MPDCFLFAGEASGDLHGSKLIKALREEAVFSSFRGVGGPLMRKEGIEPILKTEDFQVMGFSDVLKALPSLYRNFTLVRDHILKTNPSCTVLIDYPGFNLRLARSLRKKGYRGKLVQYVCPTIWAHGKKRAHTLIETLDLILTIFPFEAPLFSDTSLTVKYIGNPLVETIQQHTYQQNWRESLKIPLEQELIAIFPGSRKEEIGRHTLPQLQAAFLLKKNYPQLGFALSCAHENLIPLLQEQISRSPLKLHQDIHLVPRSFSYELMKDCRLALAKSGTVTLELALHQKPTVVLYTMTPLNYFIAKYFLQLNLPYYCIVNILGQKEIFPELIGKHIEEDLLAAQLIWLMEQPSDFARIQQECKLIQQQLGNHPTSLLACQAIRELFR